MYIRVFVHFRGGSSRRRGQRGDLADDREVRQSMKQTFVPPESPSERPLCRTIGRVSAVAPRVFMSYSHDGEEHEDWVLGPRHQAARQRG